MTSPEGIEGVEPLFQPMGIEAARVCQKAVRDAGMPLTVFFTNDIDAERVPEGMRRRLIIELTKTPWGGHAMLDDTCGNFIKLVQLG